MILARGNWFFVLLILLCAVFMTRPYLYVIQQDNYRICEIFKNKKLRLAFLIDCLATLIFCAVFVLFGFFNSRVFWGFLTAMYFFIAEIAIYFIEEIPEKRKPMRYTKRAMRALVTVALTATALMTLAMAHVNYVVEDGYYRYAIYFVFPLIFPLIFIGTMFIVNVFEAINNFRYEKKTAKILAERSDLLKIAVTGSYGKTSVKNYLTSMLSADYRVLATPESFNTPMGISKTVAALDASHEVFIAEMGARRVGDIKKLMKIVRPKCAVLTGIGTQHLQTFKTRERIIQEKLRVLTMLPMDGFAVVTDRLSEDAETMLYDADIQCAPIFAGLCPKSEVYASEIAVCEDGSVFNLHINGEVYVARTKLLGEHNVSNIALAAAAAYGLNVKAETIISKIAALSPVPHRLQLICSNGIKIIDDTFNSNPEGARCALAVLRFMGGRHIVVTPGLVELGEAQNEENYKLGVEISSIADIVMLIGEKQTLALKRGLKEGGFAGKLNVYGTLEEAQSAFKDVLHVGDTLLLLNDLPDIYAE